MKTFRISSISLQIVIILGCLLLAAGPASALPITIPVVCVGVRVGNVVVDANVDNGGKAVPGAISGNFTSAVGGPPTTLAAAAAQCGEDHFNWYQFVTALDPPLPGFTPPFVDPLPGGLGDQ